jgi:hypothetical protein
MRVRWNDLVDTKATAELERLAMLEKIFDPFSIRNLDRLGAGSGWRCLEVGAGPAPSPVGWARLPVPATWSQPI